MLGMTSSLLENPARTLGPVLPFLTVARRSVRPPAEEARDMRILQHSLILAALAVLVLAGCSGDQDGSVTRASVPAAQPAAKSIGPSELVLCLDVSDDVSAADLEAVLAALAAKLGDADLVPADGSIAVAAFVYGDTAAAVLGALVPVTPSGLDDTILPALDALNDDRLVATGAADLGAALAASLPLLDPGSVLDRHVLILAGGSVADAAAVAAACADLEAAGAMVSAVVLGTGEGADASLAACAGATGGFYGAGGDDIAGALGHALAYMLQADLALDPAAAERARGELHEVTATLFRGGDAGVHPVAGIEVSFAVTEGPNAGATATVATDEAGQAVFGYAGEGGPGTDTIVAESVHPGTGEPLGATATVVWLNAAPECDAGGPYLAAVAADTVMVQLDASGSSDADGDSLSFLWSVDCPGASFDDPTAVMPLLELTGDCLCLETLAVELMVTDGFDTTYCQTEVVLDEQRPPVIVVREPLAIWPPNHQYHTITPEMLILSAEDPCGRPLDLAGARVVEVRSNEPENQHGIGDGNTFDDIVVHCPGTVMLRAERAGRFDGRVYTIVYRLAGDAGEPVDIEAHVIVPHDQSGTLPVIGVEAMYVVVPDCD
jgi:hypothetical protein